MEINWLLLCVIGILMVCIYHGYKSGLVRMLFSVAAFLVTVVLVRVLAPIGIQTLKNNSIVYEKIKAPVESMLEDKIDGQIRTEEVLDSCQIPEQTKEDILNTAEKLGIKSIDLFTPEIKSVTADCITWKIIDVLAYVILFIMINILLRVAGMILDSFSKLPGVRGVNHAAGCVLGCAEGLVFVWLAFLIVTIFSATEWGSAAFQMISSSKVLSLLYTTNIFLIFI